MQIFLLTFLIFGLAMFALAVGWLFNQKELKGSCGGLSAVPGLGRSDCSCAAPCEKRRKREASSQQDLAKDEDVIEFKEFKQRSL